MSRYGAWLVGLALAVSLLVLVCWGWQKGGLALMQLGMGVC